MKNKTLSLITLANILFFTVILVMPKVFDNEISNKISMPYLLLSSFVCGCLGVKMKDKKITLISFSLFGIIAMGVILAQTYAT